MQGRPGVGAGTAALRALSVALPFWALWFVSSGSLRGSGDTRTPLFIGASTMWLTVLIAWIAVRWFDAGLGTVWLAFVLTTAPASVLMWWPIMSPLPELPRLSYPGQMLYCFLMSIPMSIVAVPAFSPADPALYERYGGITIVLARFMPFIRTFAPFVAGVAEMNRAKFTMFNVGGALIWVLGIATAGYFFGNLPFVREHLDKIIWALIIVPGLLAIFGAWRASRAEKAREQLPSKA